MRLGRWTVTLLLACGQPALADDAGAALAPNGKWVVDYADGMCVLQRNFGPAPTAVTVGVRPVPLSDTAELVMIAPDDSRALRQGKASVTTAEGGQLSGTFNSAPIPDSRLRVTTVYLDVDAAELMRTDRLTLWAPPQSVSVAPSASANALAALSACEDDLLTGWGVDAKSIHLLRARARPVSNPIRAFGPNDYPTDAVRLHQQGRVVVRLSISATGQVTDCKPVVSAGASVLDAATCRRARAIAFTPALGADGTPTASWYLLPVRWALP